MHRMVIDDDDASQTQAAANPVAGDDAVEWTRPPANDVFGSTTRHTSDFGTSSQEGNAWGLVDGEGAAADALATSSLEDMSQFEAAATDGEGAASGALAEGTCLEAEASHTQVDEELCVDSMHLQDGDRAESLSHSLWAA